MATADLPRPRIDYPKALWEMLSSLTENSIAASINRAKELGFDQSLLEIPLEETLMNLESSRDVLRDVITRGRLVQIPLKLQARLLQEATKISTTLIELTNGKDALRVLEAAVEDLNATIWQFNLQNQSESVLGFERKMNELKAQEVIVKRSMLRATRLEKRLTEIEDLMRTVGDIQQRAAAGEESINSLVGNAEDQQVEVNKIVTNVKGSFDLVKQYEAAIATAAVSARDSAAEATASEESASAAASEIVSTRAAYEELKTEVELLQKTMIEDKEELAEELRTTSREAVESGEEKVDAAVAKTEKSEAARELKLQNQLADSLDGFQEAAKTLGEDYAGRFVKIDKVANDLIDEHNRDVKEITDKLKGIESQIDGAILKATGFTLFHSFQTRQEQLHKSARVWAFWLGGCLLCSVVAGVTFLFMLPHFPSYGPAIYFKISLSLPFLSGVLFCGWQYTRERRLEEEYAFKSNISISLKPYQQLVDELVNKENEEERAKYTAFIISSINKVFTSPTGLVFDDTEKMPTDAAKELFKEAIGGATDIIKARVK